MVMPGLINLDFADVRSVMSEMGKAMMGTGEGEGDNRALEAAERAIANPLLDGVSMAGAKGVIISIIGGEDMKLLEVDEAANHIRELVDEDANIIWGSAFNPDLDGKIRVSVVATGIDGDGTPAAAAPRAFSMRESTAPKRPILDLPSDTVAEEEPFELNEGLAAEPEPEPAPEPEYQPSYESEPEAEPIAAESDAFDLTDEAEEEPASPFGLSPATSASYDDEDEEDYDDVDGIVDPLAGLRNEETERFDDDGDDGVPPPADDAGYGNAGEGGWSDDREPLDLSGDMAEADGGAQDEFPLGDGESPLATKPGRKRQALGGGDFGDDEGGATGGGGGGGPASLPGNTLFERMANLSRGASTSDDDDDDDDDGGSGGGLNIPRFLGRQNNQ